MARYAWTIDKRGVWWIHLTGCQHTRLDVAGAPREIADADTVEQARTWIAEMMGEDTWPEDERSDLRVAPCAR